jgi:hypothetical protein
VGVVLVAIANGKNKGLVRVRKCMLDEERSGRTPHQITCRFAHVLPLEKNYQNYIYFVRVLLVVSANRKIDVAGRSFSWKANFNEFTVSTSTWYEKKVLKVRYSALTIRNLNPYESKFFYELVYQTCLSSPYMYPYLYLVPVPVPIYLYLVPVPRTCICTCTSYLYLYLYLVPFIFVPRTYTDILGYSISNL